MATLTVYPEAGTAGTTSDGFLTSGYGATMQIAHDTATGDGSNMSNAEGYIRAVKNASGFYLSRMGFTFDTSALPDDAVITGATLSLYGTTTSFVNQSATSAVIVGFTPSANNNFATSDFGQFQFTEFCTPIALASLSQSGYNDFALNASGIAAISKTGITRLGCITEADRAVTTIGTADNVMSFILADTAGTSTDPKLVITYTVANTGAGFFMMM